jgi:DNA-binding NarL/FixJ family response regulator
MTGISPQWNFHDGGENGVPTSATQKTRAALLVASDVDCADLASPINVIEVRTVEEALTVVSQQGPDIRCAIVQASFGGGRGMDLILRIRALRPLLPILLLAPEPDKNTLTLSYAYDLELVSQDCTGPIVDRFVRSSMARPRATYEQLEERLLHMATRVGLTTGELRIVTAVTRGMTRPELLSAFDVSVNTLKSQTRSILKKTGHASLGELSRVALTGLFTTPG